MTPKLLGARVSFGSGALVFGSRFGLSGIAGFSGGSRPPEGGALFAGAPADGAGLAGAALGGGGATLGFERTGAGGG